MAFSYSPKIVTDGLVLYLDATNPYSYVSGSLNWNDLSRSQLSGSLINGPTYNTSGYVSLDGINDYIDIGNRTTLQMGTGDFTMGLWVKMNNPPNTYGNPYINVLFNCKNSPAAAAGYGITFFYSGSNQNKLLWSTGNGSSAVEILTQNAFPTLVGTWGHVVMVRQNGSTNNGCFPKTVLVVLREAEVLPAVNRAKSASISVWLNVKIL